MFFLLAQQGLNAGFTVLSAHLRGKDQLAFQRECANLHNTHERYYGGGGPGLLLWIAGCCISTNVLACVSACGFQWGEISSILCRIVLCALMAPTECVYVFVWPLTSSRIHIINYKVKICKKY